MKYLLSFFTIIFLSSCVSTDSPLIIKETKNWTYLDGKAKLDIRRSGCDLLLTFVNNSDRSLRLTGDIIVLQNKFVVGEPYINWDSRTVLPDTAVMGTTSLAVLEYGNGSFCKSNTYKNNITIYWL